MPSEALAEEGCPSAMNIECPATMRRHVQKVLGGEYDIPYRHSAPVILDIGANVGSGLGAQALARGSRPLLRTAPRQFRAAQEKPRTIRGQIGELAQLCRRRSKPDAALPWPRQLRGGSFYDIGEQTTNTVEVETKAPDVLPKAHIVKIDTEGSEVDILARMASLDFDAIMLEYHSEANRRKIDALLQDYVLAGGHIRHPNRGTLKFAHKRLIEASAGRLDLANPNPYMP